MSFEPCMCGADDCSRCHPGYVAPKQCDSCYDDSYELTAVYDGDELCDGCLADYRLCTVCEEWHKHNEVHTVEYEEIVCKDCIDDYRACSNAECRSDK